ncbi:probable salivary secreted peptide [Venturia canescens]|uniref:probable salivary secreted peptide n=1 Tax=Venturia canescens TaxID=32260 RepID=UPI001C9D3234|nr:probable salivary secreted peptide [Venturia canescens]
MRGASVVCTFAVLVAVAALVATDALPKNYVNKGFVFYAPASNYSQDMTAGAHVPGDYLYSRHNVYKRNVYNQVVTYQQVFNVTGNNVITFMRAHDRASNGGRAVLVNGGPGLKRATVRFTSQRSQSVDFVVEIYARRR